MRVEAGVLETVDLGLREVWLATGVTLRLVVLAVVRGGTGPLNVRRVE